MSPAAASERVARRCAEVSQRLGASPAGTSPASLGILIVEVPLPWPSDIGDVPGMAEVATAAAAAGHRLQAVVPAVDCDGRTRRLIRYARPPGGFDTFRRTETVVPQEDLPAGVEAILAEPVGDEPGAEVDGTVDVLVCSHGSRDACCGRSGVPLYKALSTSAPPRVRVWRTSHLGGHRFAPAAQVLPDGYSWAWADSEQLTAIATHQGDPADIADSARGCAGFDGAWAQAADSELLARHGWRWTSLARTVTVSAAPPSPTGAERKRVDVTVTGADPDSDIARRHSIVVELTGTTPVPVCGQPIDASAKSQPEVAVVLRGAGMR